jgi:hypothetical protein
MDRPTFSSCNSSSGSPGFEATLRLSAEGHGYLKAMNGLRANLLYGTGIPCWEVLSVRNGSSQFLAQTSEEFSKAVRFN